MAHFHNMVVVVVVVLLASPAAARNWDSSGSEELVKWAGYGEEKLSTVIIAGTIVCSTPDAQHQPVSGARVGVMCGMNRKARKLSAAKGSTDGSGKFSIDLPSHLHAIPNIEKACHVRVLNLPQTSPCRKACSAKHNKPITLTSIHQGIRTYTTQNIRLSPN